ncbi:MAG TPA: hypothetical protein VKV39_07950 [Candidatus Sulfotelmatobacter sp.]|nr:hypothetical protein [Candidatus Sulfotelmatobacter sp.]
MLTHDQLLHLSMAWMPGEKQFLFSGQEPERGQRIYKQDAAEGEAHAISPDGARSYFTISPDGSLLALAMGADYQTYTIPVAGGEPKAVPGIEPGWIPVIFSPDSHSLYCYRIGDIPLNIQRVEISTGRSTPWKQLMPPDPVGITYLTNVRITPDLKSYVYDFQRKLDVLYVVEGLH